MIRNATALLHSEIPVVGPIFSGGRVLSKREILKVAVPYACVCGVYILLGLNGVILYVGQSLDVQQRIAAHRREKKIVFARYVVIECPPDRRKMIEARYIREFRPPYNRKLEAAHLHLIGA